MRKRTMSFSIDQETRALIEASIAEARASGIEMDFSKWMRDAVRKKLGRKSVTREGEARQKRDDNGGDRIGFSQKLSFMGVAA